MKNFLRCFSIAILLLVPASRSSAETGVDQTGGKTCLQQLEAAVDGGDIALLSPECLASAPPGTYTCKKENGTCGGTCPPEKPQCKPHPNDSNYCRCEAAPPAAAETCAAGPAPGCGGTCNAPRTCAHDSADDKCFCKDPPAPTPTPAPSCKKFTAKNSEKKNDFNCGGFLDPGDPSCDLAFDQPLSNKDCVGKLEAACKNWGGEFDGAPKNDGCEAEGNKCFAKCSVMCCKANEASAATAGGQLSAF